MEGRDKRNTWIRVRMGLVAAVILMMYAAVAGRVYYLQTEEKDHLQEKASDQTHRSIKLKAKRGSIADRNGVELAISVEAPSIAVRPGLIADKEQVASELADIVGMDIQRVRKKLASKSAFVWLKRQANPAVGDELRERNIRGVEVHLESKRFYPLKERAGQLVGFTNIDGVGLEGLERAMETSLAGKEYRIEGVRDARGRTLLTDATPEFNRFEGNSVELTIDERIQRVAETSLAEQVEEFKAKGGYAIALDVQTGEVLALANTPSFDPNHFKHATPADWRLRIVTDTFEPGSVVKPLVLAAALQEGTTQLDTMYDCESGAIQIGKYRVRDSHPIGMATAATIVKESSNIGAYKLAQTIGRQRFYQYLRNFGFGSRTGIGLRGEQAGLVWPPDRWAEVSFANIAFGQGMTATPVQIATAVASVANGGMLLEPYVVKRVLDKDGNVVRENTPTLIRRVISPEVARQTSWAMSLVTRKGGTGTNAAMEHFTVAGKTGTAQKVDPETRRYGNLWAGSFVGFFPAERPRVAIMVMIDEPEGRGFGGVVAAPAWKKIANEAVSVLNITPVPKDEQFQFDDEQAAEMAEKMAKLAENESVDMELEPFAIEPSRVTVEGGVPDFRGLTLRAAIAEARTVGTLPNVEGWGRVVSQSPEPGTPLEDATSIDLVLSPATRESLIAEEPSLGAE